VCIEAVVILLQVLTAKRKGVMVAVGVVIARSESVCNIDGLDRDEKRLVKSL